MDNEKTRKVGITEFLNSTEVSSKISDAATGLSKAANAAMNGDRITRGYDKMMMTAGGGAHLAAHSAALDAAYSHARRVAEGVSSLTRHSGISYIAQQISDAANATAALVAKNQAQLCRETIDDNSHAAAAIATSSADRILSSLHNFNSALTFDYGFHESYLERMYEVIHKSGAASSAALPELRQERIPILPPRIPQERSNPAAEFMASFKRQYDEAVEQAEEENGEVVVVSKTPTGDVILVKQLSSLDQHFIQVTGVDQHNQPRSFKANCAGLALQIEIVPIEEDTEDGNDDNEDLVN